MSVQVTEFSLVVNGFGVEKNRRMPAKDAAFDNALGVEETAARVERISVLLNSINVEKYLGLSEKVAVENSLGNDFYKRSVKKCRYE